MISIEEVVILSVDKSEDIWDIEGEIIFEGELTTPFSSDYDVVDDELMNLELEISPGRYDKILLKSMIIEASEEFED